MINKVILVGNLGVRPELKTTNSGLSVASMRLATSDRKKDSDTGDWVDYTEWHTVTVFGAQADNCCRYLDKGRQIYVEGRLQTRKWQDKEGNDRYNTEAVADDIKFLGSRGGDRDSANGHTQTANSPVANLDDIPFSETNPNTEGCPSGRCDHPGDGHGHEALLLT